LKQIVGKDGGGDTLAHWPTTANMMTVEDAACEVLKYLDRVWASLSSAGIIHVTISSGVIIIKIFKR